MRDTIYRWLMLPEHRRERSMRDLELLDECESMPETGARDVLARAKMRGTLNVLLRGMRRAYDDWMKDGARR